MSRTLSALSRAYRRQADLLGRALEGGAFADAASFDDLRLRARELLGERPINYVVDLMWRRLRGVA